MLLYPIIQNSRYGYIRPDGSIAIRPQYQSAMTFSEGLAGSSAMARGDSSTLPAISSSSPNSTRVDHFPTDLLSWRTAIPSSILTRLERSLFGRSIIDAIRSREILLR